MSYINKDATLAAIANKAKAELADANHYFLEGVQLAVDVVEGMTEVQPERKRGKWIKVNGRTVINCSACYHCSWSLSFEDTVKRFNFCPNCGADMRGEQDG